MTAADQSIFDELLLLLECPQTDGTMADLDTFDRHDLSAPGRVLYDLLTEHQAMRAACEAAMECCGPADVWNGETQKFLRLCEAAVKKARE